MNSKAHDSLPIARVRIHRKDRKPEGTIIGMRITKPDGSHFDAKNRDKVPREIIERAATGSDLMYARYIETDEHFALSSNFATEEQWLEQQEYLSNSSTAMLADIMDMICDRCIEKAKVLQAGVQLLRRMAERREELHPSSLERGLRVVELERRLIMYQRSIDKEMASWVPGPDYLDTLDKDSLSLDKDE